MRILGLDIGSYSVKALEVETAFGRYEIKEYHEIRTQGRAPEAVAAQLVGQLPRKPDRVIVALPASRLTLRNLTLPTRDKKAIQAGVAFELEDELPFDPDNVAFDSTVIHQSKQATTLHITATLKKAVEELIGGLKLNGIDPDLVTSEAWAFRAHLNRVLNAATQEQPTLLVQLGHERTLIYAHRNGFPQFCREIPWGGRDISEAIASRYGIPAAEADTAKVQSGFIATPNQTNALSADQREFSNVIRDSLGPMLLELRQAVLRCKTVSHDPPSQILLSGGTSMLPGLGQCIEEEFKIPTKALPALSSIANSGVTYSDFVDSSFLTAAGFCLSQIGSERGLAPNLRKGEFSKRGASAKIRFDSLRKPMLALGAIVICMTASLVVQKLNYRNQLRDVDDALGKSVRAFFPSASSGSIKGYLSSTSNLRKSIDRELAKQREIAKLSRPNPRSPLEFLRDLSGSISKATVVDLVEFKTGTPPAASYLDAGEPTTSLTFHLKDPKTAERLASVLGAKLTGMSQSKVDALPGSRWKVTFSGGVRGN